ncbi:insecticidal delta-endotoxin Cry8Ea1 family protein [Bacillus cereus]|uniref:insecticidal delta-endotoxin Cry8Ea1 family protein n=1 Tax=Bacillus cereus TaxID=1396 RepID=UPI0009AB1A7E|nr:insecticidal delta-endotoxin Cry8Ea1 family protein [Bacillus cereus]PFN13046.1 hypothetical protein COJ72_23965 [Bacillus cereus]
MKNKKQKVLHMTVAASVLATTYVPAANFAFAQEKQEQGLKETQVTPFNELKEKITENPNLDNSRMWNPYKGVDYVKFMNALNSNVWKPVLTDAVKNEGENVVPVLIKGAIVMGLSLAPPPLPILGTVVDLFQFTDGKTDDAWSRTVEYVNKTIDSKIEQYHSYLMSSELVALGSSLGEYKRVLEIYETNKLTRVEDPAAGVREQFRISNDKAKAFIAKLQHPQNQGDTRYNVLTLPLFAQAANLHLALLRDAIVCDWGIDSNQLQGYKDELKRSIIDYTNYINKTYKEGLEQEKNKAADYSDPESYIQAGKNDVPVLRQWFPEVMKWNRVANYERQMSASVLDLAAVLPTYDSDNYSKQPIVKQSRPIFAPVIGIPGGLKSKDSAGTFGSYVFDVKNFDQINTELTKSPYDYLAYGGTLNQIGLRTSGPIYGSSTNTTYYTNMTHGSTAGNQTNISISPDNPITSISGTAGTKPYTLSFQFADGTKTQTFGSNVPNGNCYAPFKFEYPGYQLSAVRVFGTSVATGDADAMVFAFRSSEIGDTHQLMANVPTQIPAEIGYGQGNTFHEVINGQNAIEMNNGNTMKYSINSPKTQQYKVRYRVAANEESSVRLQNMDTIISKTTDTSNTSMNTVKGEYGYYKLVEGPTITLNKGMNTVTLQGTKGKFALDYVEVDPVVPDGRVYFEDFIGSLKSSWYGSNSGFAPGYGTVHENGELYTFINEKVEKYSQYVMRVKLKLNSNDPNIRENVRLFTDNAKGERITKEVTLRGGADYQEFNLEFMTNDNLDKTHIGVQKASGSNTAFVKDVEVIGALNDNATPYK